MKSQILLTSTADCRKAIAYLTETGELEETDVVLRLALAQDLKPQPTDTQCSQGRHTVVLRDNNMICQSCGKVFRSKHQALTIQDRVLFESLSPRRPFAQQIGTRI